MPTRLIVFLMIGTVLMGIPMVFTARKYGIALWKGIMVTVLLTVSGTVGTYLMYYAENGVWGGLSFFGAVFLVPIVFIVVAFVLRMEYGEAMDLCAIGECIMLALMKVHCMLGGCCNGRVLFVTEAGAEVVFPSQLAELIVALILFVILLSWAFKGKRNGLLYAWYLLLYGSTRFVLNIFREAWVTKEMILPIGNIWSLVAIAIGVIFLCICKKNCCKMNSGASADV